MKPLLKKLASLKVTATVLAAFLVLTFWGTLAQANAESAGFSASVAIDRFFDSYFICGTNSGREHTEGRRKRQEDQIL